MKINKENNLPVWWSLPYHKTIKEIAERSAIPPDTVALVFHALRYHVAEKLANDEDVPLSFGNIRLRKYNWKGYKNGMMFFPCRDLLRHIREKYDKNIMYNEKQK